MGEERTGWKPYGKSFRWDFKGPAGLRIEVWSLSDTEWCYAVGVQPGHIFYVIETNDDPDPLPTREAAQAAAEAWVREFARGLLGAVGEAP